VDIPEKPKSAQSSFPLFAEEFEVEAGAKLGTNG
jgi:hypothetical protein